MEDSVEDGTEGGYTAYPAGHFDLWTLGDLAGLSLGARIRNVKGDEFTLVEECGGRFWVRDPEVPGVLYSALASWLPVTVL